MGRGLRRARAWRRGPLFAALALVLGGPAWALAQPPGRTVATVLTMTPGAHAFERFGHTALRIDPPDGAAAIVYNFGTFDGTDPGMVRKFLADQLPYWLSVAGWERVEAAYASRRITLQELALTDEEARALAAALAENARPENRVYRYEFFRDNCSTRVRDAVARVAPELMESQGRPGGATYRGHVRAVLAPVPLYRHAIDLALNETLDEPVTRWDEAFLPRELERLLDETRRKDGRPLVARTTWWNGPEHDPAAREGKPIDGVAVAMLALLGVLAAAAWDGGVHRLARALAGGMLAAWGVVGGLLGCLLVVTSLTPHAVARMNGNLTALSPLLLVLVPYGARLALGRLGAVGIERLRAILVALGGPIVVDLAGHLFGLAHHRHLGLLGCALAVLVLAFLASRRARERAAALAT